MPLKEHQLAIEKSFKMHSIYAYSVRRWNTSHCIISLCQVPYGLDEGLNPANIRSQDDRWIHLAMPHLQGASSCTPIGSFHCSLDIQHTYPLNLTYVPWTEYDLWFLNREYNIFPFEFTNKHDEIKYWFHDKHNTVR